MDIAAQTTPKTIRPAPVRPTRARLKAPPTRPAFRLHASVPTGPGWEGSALSP